MLACLGGAAGVGLAWALTRWAAGVTMDAVDFGASGIDTRSLAFTLVLSFLTGILCGLAPAWHGRRLYQAAGLRRAGVGSEGSRLRSALVMAEVACAVVLLAGAGPLVHSLVRVLRTPLGFQAENVLLLRTAFNRQRYPAAEARHRAQRAITTRLAALPGIDAVGITTNLPLTYVKPITYHLAGADPTTPHPAFAELIDDEYFRAMGIPLMDGRTFSLSDAPTSTPVAIVNQSLARRSWPGKSALGNQLVWGERKLMVVGVSGDVREQARDRDVEPMLYLSIYQAESAATENAGFVIRTKGNAPETLAAAARTATGR